MNTEARVYAASFQIEEEVCAKKYKECSSRSWKSMEMGFFPFEATGQTTGWPIH